MFVFRSGLKMLLVVGLAVAVMCCNEKKEAAVFEKLPHKNRDATFEWLHDEPNSHKDNFMPVFYDYYRKTLHENNLEKAAAILDIVCNRQIRNWRFDDKFTKTITYFAANYQSKLPVESTLFVNTYFCALHQDKGDFETAIYYASKTTKIAAKDYDTCNEKGYAFIDLAYCYHTVGKQDLAIKNNFEALHYFNKNQNLTAIAGVYSSLGTIYQTLNEFDNAEKYYDQALTFLKKANDLKNVFNTLNNKIILYEISKDARLASLVDSTFHYFNKSGLVDDDIKILTYSSYINKLFQQDKLVEAKKFLDEIYPLVRKLDSRTISFEFDVMLTEFKIRNKETIDTQKILNDIIPYLTENEEYVKLKMYYFVLKENAVQYGDYKSALLYEEKRTQAITDLTRNANSNKVIELDKKYQNQKKERQIATQEKMIAKKNATIAWLAFAILIVIVVVVIYQSKQKQKKLKLEKQSAQNYTKQLLEKTEEERKRIASDLHDSVSHDLLGLKNLFEEKATGTNAKIDAIINDIRIISRNLHPVMFDKIGLKESIMQLVERAQSVNDFMLTAEIEYQSNLGSLAELQIYRIVQESVSNIIKYAQAVAAKITISEVNNKIYIEIKDNGKGFDVEVTLANDAAFGLHNIIERSRAIGGQAKIVSDTNGTVITIEINT